MEQKTLCKTKLTNRRHKNIEEKSGFAISTMGYSKKQGKGRCQKRSDRCSRKGVNKIG